MELKKYLRIYWMYFIQFWKTRLVYKADFTLGFFGQAISLGTSLAFLTLIFTQVNNINGWSYNELLLLAGFSGMIMNIHHVFLFNIFHLGENYIVNGKFDRFLVRPLNPLFQVYADNVSDNNLSKLIINIALIVYASLQIGLDLTVVNILYSLVAIASGVLVFASTYLIFATTAFWTGQSKNAIWLIFRMSDFRKYPFSIYSATIQVILVTLIPIAFASFFPVTFILGREEWAIWQIATIFVGPVFYLLAFKFWKFGMKSYSSTGS